MLFCETFAPVGPLFDLVADLLGVFFFCGDFFSDFFLVAFPFLEGLGETPFFCWAITFPAPVPLILRVLDGVDFRFVGELIRNGVYIQNEKCRRGNKRS